MDKQPAALTPSACPPPESDFGKRAFMRMVSHELRTPLNSIIGFAEVLTHELYGPLGAPQYTEYAGIIRDSGKKLLSLFNDVLELVRLESEPNLLRPEIETLPPHIHDAARRHAACARARGVNILPGLTDAELSARFDPRGLGLCLDHLIGNAIDFTPEGRDVEITARPDGEFVDIAVFNPGKAPDPADIPRLMRPFEQGASDYNRSREGAGLGWSIVKLASEAMGGSFSVQSDPRNGLKATVRLKRR
ncbi:MAG: HAMP domain-containing histidine kinase [Asticcacaulis sp.]|uniref:sensor histidine kinase n=1 Tax=Asticcacaulis sp. TaxID=1872648 RepID=UPI0025C34979|nr:HAMP domain-containing sensor histidine kinase [Asticcacaulis sp.]MCA1935005.1 HAMP domain-containing histidine kinase [Asticcacaulis sp.]